MTTDTLNVETRQKGEKGLNSLLEARGKQDEIDARLAKGGEPASAEEERQIKDLMADYIANAIEARTDTEKADDTTAIRAEVEDSEVRAKAEIGAVEMPDGDRPSLNVRAMPKFTAETRELVFRGVAADCVPTDGRDLYSDRHTLMGPGDLERRAHSVGTATAGGNTFTAGWVSNFYSTKEQYKGFMDTMPTVLMTDHGRDVKWPVLNQFGTAALVAEAGTLAGDDMKFGTIELEAYKIGRYTLVSRELFEDTDIPLEMVIAEDFGRSVAKVEDSWFVAGTGTVQPTGVANAGAAGGTVLGGTTVATLNPTFDNLIDMVYALDRDILMENNACYLMTHATNGAIAKLKDTDGQYLWRPNLVEARPMEIVGYPIKSSPHLPAVNGLSNRVIFGDFRRGCVVRTVNSARYERSEHFAFNTDQTALRITLRTDMKIRDASALVAFRSGTS